jgi:hypothetical protein
VSILRRPGLGGNDGTPTRRLPYFTARTAPEALARQLTTQLQLKLGLRLTTVQNLGELRALPTRALDDRGAVAPECIYVGELSKSFHWKRMESAADDNIVVIRPDDVAASALGRFVAAPFRDFERRFYVQHVQHVHNSQRRKELQELAGGKFPCLFISYVAKQPQELVQNRGALQWDDFSFRVRAISVNYRGEPGAALGSDVAEEATYDAAHAAGEDFDPGATNIIADVEQFLRENVRLNDPRIGRVIIGASRSLEQWGAERLQMDELTLTIHACTWVPNIPQDLVRLDLIKVQLQDVTEDDAGAVTLTDIGDQMQVNPDRAHAEASNG